MFALDTNTLIYFFKGQGAVAGNLRACTPGEVVIPAVVVYELERGIEASGSIKRRRALQQLVKTVSVLPFDGAAARVAASIRVQLDRAGTPIGVLDGMIAGTVVVSGATLVTNNVREFRRVPGLRVVDWY